MTWMTAAVAARSSHHGHPAADAPAKLLDTSALARFVDPLPIPALAKPVGLRPSPVDPALQTPYYRIVMRQST
jgi:spore coat protein A, manganese oxidase